ncbi:MAG: MFS transporter [Negativicutes bacterium]|nr:MFS transporter [Negativicutes bacterium]
MRLFRQGSYPLALLTVGHFFGDFYNNFLPPLLPVVMASLGMSLTSAGLLVMIFAFTGSVLQPVFGYLVDKKGYGWLILATLPVGAVFICTIGLAPNYLILVAGLTLAGLGFSVFHPLASSLVSRVAAPENKGLAMSIFIGGGNFGFAVSPAIVIAFLLEFGIEKLPWLILPSLGVSLACYLYGLHRIPLVSPRPATSSKTVAWYQSVNLLKLNGVMALRSWSQMALPNFLPVWLALEGHAPMLAGNLLTVYLLGGAVGGFIGGWLGDKVGRKACIIGLLSICLPSLFLFTHSTEINLLAWLALAISGAALQGTLPSSIVWAQDMIPGNAAMASGMMLGLAYGLGGVGVAITGAVADIVGLKTALLWSLLPLALAIPLAATIPEKQHLDRANLQ